VSDNHWPHSIIGAQYWSRQWEGGKKLTPPGNWNPICRSSIAQYSQCSD